MPSNAQQHGCQSCRKASLLEVEGFGALPRVTSDSKPFRPGGRLFVCPACGLVQKIADDPWRAEIAEIYAAYAMYHQSSCNDQLLFDPVSGRPAGRCEVIARQLLETGRLPAAGSLLDVGAGTGAMLAAFSSAQRGWRLFALDLDRRSEPALKRIPGFATLFTGSPDAVGERFDLITLIHSLEHFSEPLAMLKRLRDRLAPGGRLFIEVNDVHRTPFDLLVADHLCHFSAATLEGMLRRAGFAPQIRETAWVAKELSVLAEATPVAGEPQDDDHAAMERTTRDVAWLAGMLKDASARAHQGVFGIFGTSVAATWLASALGETVSFFVDEDPGRRGRTHLGRPILAPQEAPRGATVYLAFARATAEAIRGRLSGLPLDLAAPPDQA